MSEYERPKDGNESKLGTTWADVEGMIKLRAFPKWAGRLLGALVVVVLVLCVLVGIGYIQNHRLSQQNQTDVTQLKAYTDQKVMNECAALELLTKTPVPKPADPKANPSREATYKFYVALQAWAVKDGCKP